MFKRSLIKNENFDLIRKHFIIVKYTLLVVFLHKLFLFRGNTKGFTTYAWYK